MTIPNLLATASVCLLPATALAAAGNVIPIHPLVPNSAGTGFLEVVGDGFTGRAEIVVQLDDVATDDTAFMNNLSVVFYNDDEFQIGLSLVIPAQYIHDKLGNNDGNIDGDDILTLDVTTVLQNRPAGAYAMDVVYADPGGDGDSMTMNSDGFPAPGLQDDTIDQLYRIIDERPQLVSAIRSDSDKNGLDDTMTIVATFPTLGFGNNADIRSSFRTMTIAGIENPNSVTEIEGADWELNMGDGFMPLDESDGIVEEPVPVGATVLSFRFDEMNSDLRVSGPIDLLRASPFGTISDGTGNILEGEVLLMPTLCDDGEAIIADCNGNSLCDRDEIAMGMVRDCNENTIPDICEIMAGAEDHNGNGILDECEPDPSADLNGDGVVDTFDLAIILAQWGPVLP